MDFDQLLKSDAEFLEHAMKSCHDMNESLVKTVIELNQATLKEWNEKFQIKCEAVISGTSDWIEKMSSKETEWAANAVEDYAKKVRRKNEETLIRLGKSGKKTKEYLNALKIKFEATANELIEMEKERLIAENIQVRLRNLALMQGQDRFSKTKEEFIKGYLKEEKELIERISSSTKASDETIRKDFQEADEEFRKSLKKELVGEEFPETKFLLLVSTRDKKRQDEVVSWHGRRESEFHKVIDRVKADNVRVLDQLETEFKELFGVIPTAI